MSTQSATLFNHRARLNLDAIAFLAMTLHIINPEDERLDALGQMMLNRAVTRASGTFFEETYRDRWNWSSNLRSTALVLDALLKIQPRKRAPAQYRAISRRRSPGSRILVIAPGHCLDNHRAHQLDEA